MAALEQDLQRGARNSRRGETVDFVDGVVFARNELYLTWGRSPTGLRGPATTPEPTSTTGRSPLRGPGPGDYLTTHDYLWRWDTDWFWCSRAFGLQHPVVRRLWPRSLKRSDVYRKLVAWDRRTDASRLLDYYRGRPPKEPVIQDIEVEVGRAAEFLDFFHTEIGMSPVWLCPLRLREDTADDTEPVWPLYPLKPRRLYVNFGFWGLVPIRPGGGRTYHNRLIEKEVTRLGGHKSLYSDAFYDEDEFWELYNGEIYRKLKAAYDPDGRLLDLYTKCVGGG